MRNSARTSWGLTLARLAHVVIRMELMERGIRNWNGRRKKKAWGKSSRIGNGGRGEGGVRKEARNRTAEGKCGAQRDACDNTVLCECDIIHDFFTTVTCASLIRRLPLYAASGK